MHDRDINVNMVMKSSGWGGKDPEGDPPERLEK